VAISAISPQGEPGKRPPVASRRTSFSPVARVAILGFGTVGKAVADSLCNTPQLGIRVTHVFNRDIERKRVSWVPKSVEWTDDLQQILASDVDVVVEVAGGLEPAKQWVQRALLAGKSVVTANKHLMAVHGGELLELARQTGQHILYGASVAGGVPVLNALEHGLAGDTLVKVAGVLNGTCNYILSNMESRGTSLASALTKVQKLGYAEADPSDDLNGLDAACKLAIVARVGFRADIRPEAIFRRSIESVEPCDFECARELGCTIRQVSMAEIRGKSLLAAVQPMLVPFSSPLSRTKDSQNALVVTGRHGGETVFSGRGAGGGPTAVAIVSDLLALRRNVTNATGGERLQARRVSGNFSLRHILRFRTPKRSGLPVIIEALSRVGVEVESVLREAKQSKAESFLALLVKPCRPSTIEDAVREIAGRTHLANTAVYLPILPAS
jgi:homoserine dehydrogenase